MEEKRKRIISVSLLLLGLFLLAGYFVSAAVMDQFIDPDLNYGSVHNMKPLGLIRKYHNRDFARSNLLSVVWKWQLLLPATLCLVGFLACRMPKDSVDRFRELGQKLCRRSLLWGVSLGILVVLVFLSAVVFQGEPVYDDERCYDFSARLMTQGMLYADPPPGESCFAHPFILATAGRWVGKYTVGHPFLLYLGYVAGNPYFLLFLMAAVLPWLLYGIGRHLYDQKTGIIAAMLLLFCPAFLFPAATKMNHLPALFMLAVFTWAYLRMEKAGGWGYSLLAGLALGATLNIRPQEAAGYGMAFVAWSVIKIIKQPKPSVIIRQVLVGVGALPMIGAFLWYNHAITGDWLLMPFTFYKKLYPPYNPPPYPYLTHVFVDGAYSFIKYVRMNSWLFGWPFSLVFVLIYYMGGQVRRRDFILTGSILTLWFFYVFYGGHGVEELGPRYYYPLLIPALLLSVRGMLVAHAWCKKHFDDGVIRAEVLVPAFVVLSMVLGAVTFVPEKCIHFRQLSDAVKRPYDYVAQQGVTNAIVHVMSRPPTGWVFGLRNPSPDLSDDVIYVRPHTAKDLIDFWHHQPDRRLYRMKYDPATDEIDLAPLTRGGVEAEQGAAAPGD